MTSSKEGCIKNTLQRQLVLFSYLINSRYHNRNDIMKQMNYGSLRTMERDIKHLKDAGIIFVEYELNSDSRYSDLGGELIDEGYNYDVIIPDEWEFYDQTNTDISRLQRLARIIVEFPNLRYDRYYPYYDQILEKYDELFPFLSKSDIENDLYILEQISPWIELDSDLFWESEEAAEIRTFSSSYDVINGKGQLLSDETVVFDTETTGLSVRRNNIIKIEAVKIREGKVIGKFMEYVNPGYKISNTIQEMTGIDADRLSISNEISVVLDNFLGFVGDAILATNGAWYNYAFLKVACEQYGIPMDKTIVDLSRMARIIVPNIDGTTMAKICDAMGIDPHEAMDQSTLMAIVYTQMVVRLSERGITTIDQLEEYPICME